MEISRIQLLNYIDDRESKLITQMKKLKNIKDERRRHPAWKQTYGRILELKQLKKEFY
jgi:hypothetical protein